MDVLKNIGITSVIKDEIYAEVSSYDKQNILDDSLEFFEHYGCKDIQLQDEYKTILVLYRFSMYLGLVHYDWLPIPCDEFCNKVEDELIRIERLIIDNSGPIDFYIG